MFSNIQLLCREYDLAPAKSRGQNFLIDENVVKKIIASADLKKSDMVLEVGPGLGVLTKELIQRVKKVVAVELDKKLVAYLQAQFAGEKNLAIVNGDILKVRLDELELKPFGYKVVANLPYSITSVFLRLFTSQSDKPSEMILMVQKEVAERIVAEPGEMSVLSVAMQFYAEVKILFKVGKGCFWPKPKVDSAVISLKLRKNLPKIEEKLFFKTVKIGFSARRKQLHNNLAGGFKRSSEEIKAIFADLGLPELVRAQDLSVSDWVKLANSLCRPTSSHVIPAKAGIQGASN